MKKKSILKEVLKKQIEMKIIQFVALKERNKIVKTACLQKFWF